MAVGIALMLALAGSLVPAGGQAPDVEADLDPHTPVASDGSVGGMEAATELQSIPAFRGTGERSSELTLDALAEFAHTTESAEEVWALWALPPATGKVGAENRENIIGPDNRVRVNPTTTYPARAVVLVTFNGGRCTGWLYGRDVVATAGHCVHTGGPGGAFRTNVRVYPGRNGSSSPYGSCSARRLHTVAGWTSNSNEQYDYGAIKLNCRIGNTTGWFGYFWQSTSLTGRTSLINGYPGDKPLTQWRSSDRIRVTQTRQVFYANDTTGGMSGGPVYYNRSGCGYCSLAIHAYGFGHNGYPHNTYNHGTRITQAVFNNLTTWRNVP